MSSTARLTDRPRSDARQRRWCSSLAIYLRCLLCITSVLLLPEVALSQGGMLVVHVTYLRGEDLDGVVIRTVGNGSRELTAGGGIARIALSIEVKSGDNVELQVLPSSQKKEVWVFISPYDRRVTVPPFGAGRVVLVVLAKKSDMDALLGTRQGRQAVFQSINSAEIGRLHAPESPITEEQHLAVLKEQAATFGLQPEQVAAALRGAAISPDPYEQGLAALFQQDYTLASKRLGQAAAASEKELGQARDKAGSRPPSLGPRRSRYSMVLHASQRALEAEHPDTPTAIASLNGLEQAREKLGNQSFFLGQALDGAGRYRDATAAFRRALEMRGEHPAALNGLGLALIHAGDLPEAARIFDRALTVSRRGAADEHMTLAIEANLAETLGAQGDLAGARKLQEQVIEALRQVLGPRHPDTLTAISNLAATLGAQGDLVEARKLQEQGLEARRRLLGAEHPDTLTAMNNLGETLRAQGDLAGARQLQEQVLEARRRLLGAEHPDTLTAMSNLALTLRAQSDLVGARKLQERVLDTRRRVLGAEHPGTLTAMNNLALTLRAQGDLAGARKLNQQVFEARRRVLGAEHPDTLTVMNNLALILRAQGDLAGARTLNEQVFETRRRVLGAEHPETLIAMSNLAVTLEKQRDLAGARKLEEQVLEIRRRVLGAEHPLTLTVMSNLAVTLRAQGDLAGARTLQEQVLEARRRLLGPRHSDTTVTEWNLLVTRRALGDDAGSRDLVESLGWLLVADEATLSADQREIRHALRGTP